MDITALLLIIRTSVCREESLRNTRRVKEDEPVLDGFIFYCSLNLLNRLQRKMELYPHQEGICHLPSNEQRVACSVVAIHTSPVADTAIDLTESLLVADSGNDGKPSRVS